MKKKYIISGMLGTLILGFTTVFALNIVTPTTTNPIFKAVYIGGNSAGTTPSCMETTSPICLDSDGVYLNLGPVANSNILKWNSIERKFSVGPLNGSDIPDNIITSTHIFDTAITNNKFDPSYTGFRIPNTGEMVATTGNCGPGMASTGMTTGLMSCVNVSFLTGPSIPNCGAMGFGYTLMLSGTQRVCKSNVINVLGEDDGDTNWSGSTTGDIRNKNTGNIGVGLTGATEKLTIQDSFSVNGGGGGSIPEMMYCHKTDSWVDKSTYDEDNCAVCDTGYTYSGSIKSCIKDTNCTTTNGACGTATGSAYFTSPTTNLCQDVSSPARTAGLNGTWTWTCLGANGGTNASCISKEMPLCGTASGSSVAQNTTIPTPYCTRGAASTTPSSATAGTQSRSCSQFSATANCSLTVTAE